VLLKNAHVSAYHKRRKLVRYNVLKRTEELLH